MMKARSLPMKALSPIALLALAVPCVAADAQQPAPPVVVTRPATAPQPRKIPGLSDEGSALYAKSFGTQDSQLVAIARQQRTVQGSLVSIAMGAKVDVDKLADLLKQRDTLQLQFRTRQNEIIVAMLRQMTDEDRGIYLRVSMTPPTTPPTAAAR
jgi:hypothetical protein